MKGILDFFKQLFAEWSEDKVPVWAAALAYYTVFALAPLLLLIIGIIGLVFDRGEAQAAVIGQIGGLLGSEGAEMVGTMLDNAARSEASGIATVISVVVLLIAATGLFAQLQQALNHIWNVKPKPQAGLWNLVRVRILSVGMILAIGFLLLVSLLLSTVLTAAGTFFGGLLPGADWLWQVVNFLVSFIVITLLFAMIFKFLPDAVIAWRDVWVGAAVTALLFEVGRFLIGLYLGRSAVASTYGAAGSLIIILLWVYYSAQLLLFGGEFTQVYAKRRGTGIQPDENAVLASETG